MDGTNSTRYGLSRRAFLGGVTASAVAAILAACGGNATDTPKPATTAGGAPTTAPTTAAAATTTSGSAAAATRPAGSATTGTTTASTPAVVSSPSATTAAASASSAGSATTVSGKPGGSIIIGTLGEASTINPFVSADSEGDWRIKMLFDQLTTPDPATFVPKPALAKSWKIDNLTFTFTLDDANFSDGTPVTADDVAFTMKGILAKATASPRQTYLLAIQGAKEYAAGTAQDVAGIKVMDPKTLVVTLAQPDASFLLNLQYVSPVPKKLLDGKDLSKASKEAFFQKPVGAGAFTFVSWNVGGDFVAQKNPNYYRKGLPYLDKFTHRTIPDAQSLVNALLSGDIDASNYPSPAGANQLKAKSDLSVLVPPFNSPDGWQFNFKNPWLAKKEVRQAVAYALDMNQFAKDSLYGLGQPGVGPIAPGLYAFDKTLKPYAYDLDKAKTLIKQAGTPPDGIKFTVNKGNVLREDFLTYTQAQLDKLGWKIAPEAIEYASAVDRVTKKDFDVAESSMASGGADIDPAQLLPIFSSTGSQNYASYSNPQVDDLLKRATQELDIEKQKPLYAQIQQIIMDELPTHYAWYRPFLHVVKKKFTGYVDSNGPGGLFNALQNWSITG